MGKEKPNSVYIHNGTAFQITKRKQLDIDAVISNCDSFIYCTTSYFTTFYGCLRRIFAECKR